MPQADPLRFIDISIPPAPPGNPVIADDPFASLPGPVHFNYGMAWVDLWILMGLHKLNDSPEFSEDFKKKIHANQ